MHSTTSKPYSFNAKFDSRCTKCKEKVFKNELILYYPYHKEVYCQKNGCRDFALLADEKETKRLEDEFFRCI